MSAPLDVALVEVADDDLLARGDPRPGVDDQLVASKMKTSINKRYAAKLLKVCPSFFGAWCTVWLPYCIKQTYKLTLGEQMLEPFYTTHYVFSC